LRRIRRLSLLLLCVALPIAAAADIRLTQPDGSPLVLSAPAQRIVTLAPHLAEGVFAAGAGPRLLATVEYSEYPPAAASLPRIGDAFRLDIERIVALRPDLVLAWDSGNPRQAVAQLRELGLPVWSVEIRAPAEIPDFIDAVGRAAGVAEHAAPVARDLRHRLRELTGRYRDAAPRRYFYQVDAKPLFTINGEHLISRGLALCGGVNIFAGEPGLAFQTSRESVIVADPDTLFAPGLPDAADPLAAWREWPGMRAVRNESLYLLPADEISRATPRFLDSLERACKLLHNLRARDADG
jgi:iron complex transport system substrate-binding protein